VGRGLLQQTTFFTTALFYGLDPEYPQSDFPHYANYFSVYSQTFLRHRFRLIPIVPIAPLHKN
jgi:hypothetical protein